MTAPVIDDTTVFSPSAEVAAFVAAVRDALDDLAAEERDELLDGLDAELLDRVADSGPESLGDPVTYAAELRAAAGLPPRRARRSGSAGVRDSVRILGEQARTIVRQNPRLRGALDFVLALRPAWWVLRAIVAYQVGVFLFSGMGGGSGWWLLPIDGGKLLVVAILTVVSVQFGRGKWRALAGPRAVGVVVNIALAVATPVVIGHAVTTLNNQYWANVYYEDVANDVYPDFATTPTGNPVFNVFAYDAEGNPVHGVRLYDQDGQPLNLVGYPDAQYVWDPRVGDRVLLPSSGIAGSMGWHVYPLSTAPASAVDADGWTGANAAKNAPAFPFESVAPLPGAEVDATAQAGEPGATDDAGAAASGAKGGAAGGE